MELGPRHYPHSSTPIKTFQLDYLVRPQYEGLNNFRDDCKHRLLPLLHRAIGILLWTWLWVFHCWANFKINIHGRHAQWYCSLSVEWGRGMMWAEVKRCHLVVDPSRRAIANEIATQTIGRLFVSMKKLYLYCTAYVPPLITKAPQGETALNYRFLLVKLLFFDTLFPLY